MESVPTAKVSNSSLRRKPVVEEAYAYSMPQHEETGADSNPNPFTSTFDSSDSVDQIAYAHSPPSPPAPARVADREHVQIDNGPGLPASLSVDSLSSSNASEATSIVSRDSDIWSESKPRSFLFQLMYYGLCLAFIYFVLVGLPLWKGVPYYIYDFFFHHAKFEYAWVTFAFHHGLMNFLPIIFGRFDEPASTEEIPAQRATAAMKTALIIPCYKSADSIGATLEAALHVFPPQNIFVIDNCNSATPKDNTQQIARSFGVNYAFVPIGSKITAEYVAVQNSRKFRYCMIIDDDVLIPHNIPLPVDRFHQPSPKVACVGYTICCSASDGQRGTPVQQLQDFEYRKSGLTRQFSAKWGSAMFAHGAIMLWRRSILMELFASHPGFFCSEDSNWGRCAREAGYRIDFISTVFVKTTPPPYAFTNWESKVWPVKEVPKEEMRYDPTSAATALEPHHGLHDAEKMEQGAQTPMDEGMQTPASNAASNTSNASSRGGYGEMTVLRQRFFRWNLFRVWVLFHHLKYLAFYWNLGWRIIAAKWVVWCCVFTTVIYIITPFVLPIMLWASVTLTLRYMAITLAISSLGVIAFNLFHLRNRPEGRVSWRVLLLYFPYKFVLRMTASVSMYYTIYRYGRFFAMKKHRVPKNPHLPAIMDNIVFHRGDGTTFASVKCNPAVGEQYESEARRHPTWLQ